MIRRFVPLLLLLLGASARAQTTFNVDTAQSSISYTLVHKLHKFSATSKKVEGKGVLTADGRAQVMVRASVESFDSENVNRDAHMKEAAEANRFPTVELRALADGLSPPTTFPTQLKKTFKIQLTFHGEKQLFELPVDVTWESPDRARATCQFKISLDAYKIERPSLMFVKVEDDILIDVKLAFKK